MTLVDVLSSSTGQRGPATIRVAIVGGHELNRYGLRAALDGAAGIEVVADMPFEGDVAEVIRRDCPHVVLLDTVEPCRDARTLTRQVLGWRPHTAVLVVAAQLCDCSHEVVRAGARGLLLKDVGPTALAQAVRSVAEGYTLMPADVSQRICQPCSPAPAPSLAERLGRLSPRERDVLACLATGATNAEIAQCLQLGDGTIKSHVQHILTKLGLRDRVQAVIFAYQVGLVRVSSGASVPQPCDRAPVPTASRRPSQGAACCARGLCRTA